MTTITLSTFRTQVDNIVLAASTDSDNELVQIRREQQIKAAMQRYSKDRNVYYTWSAGSSTTSVSQTAHGLSLNNIVYKNTASTWVSTDGGNDLLGTHKVTTLTDANNFVATELAVNIPAQDFFAICALAACLLCQAIASKYARTSDSTISADSVNHPTRAREFRTLANVFCQQYNEYFETDDTNAPAGTYVDWDTAPGWPANRQFLFHGGDVR